MGGDMTGDGTEDWRASCVVWYRQLMADVATEPGIIRPAVDHYAAAYDQLAISRAMAEIHATDRVEREVSSLMRQVRQLLDAEQQSADASIRAWATVVRRRAGVTGANPGTGWHEVHRGE